MTGQPPNPPSPKRRDPNTLAQFFHGVAGELKLFWRCFKDPRISFWLKAAYVLATSLYIVLPDLLPGLPFDDVAAPVVFAYVFTALCPDNFVAEHREALTRPEPRRDQPNPTPVHDEDVVEAEVRDVD